MRRRLLALAVAALAFLPFKADAQQTRVYSSCGGSAWATNDLSRPLQLLNDGRLCISGTISATLSGFAPNGNYTTLTATAASSASTALPAGTDVAFQNTSTIDVSCVITNGASTATTNKIIVRGGATVFLTVGSATTAACINQTGVASNVVVLMGGTGLGSNFGGGGGGGGGGGAVTIADGADVNEGATADVAVAAGASGTVSAKLRRLTTDIGAILTQATGVTSGGDGVSNTATGNLAYARMQFYNGTTWDRWRGAVTLADGGDVSLGATTDAAATAGGAGSAQAKFRLMTTQLAGILTAAQGANPVNVNTVVTAQTGLTPGASASSQTGTIVAANTDVSSVAGVALGVPANFGSSPGAVRVPGVNAAVIPNSTAGTQTAAVASSLVLKASAGALISVTVTIGATSGWLMIFEATSAPADGAVTPKYCRYVKSDGTGGASSISWGDLPLTFATGITAVFSSTGCFTKTASATAYFSGQVQ